MKFLYFLLNTLLKLSEKWAMQMKLFNIPFAVCKRVFSIYEIPNIYDKNL